MKQKEVNATKTISQRVVATSLQVVNDFNVALSDPMIANVPDCIKKKSEKANACLLDVQKKAQENLCSSDPEPWDENFLKEWPSKLSTWKSICVLLSEQCALVSHHA